MTLASGADVELNGTEYVLAFEDEEVREPYIHWYESLYGSEERTGGDVKESPNKALRFFVRDSFHKGSGTKFFDPDNPGRYWKGDANPRGFPGSVTSPPTRTQELAATLSISADWNEGTAFFVRTDDRVWVFCSQQGWYSEDEGATWTENTEVETLIDSNIGNAVESAGSDGTYPWFSFFDNADSTPKIYYCNSTTTVAEAVDAITGNAAHQPMAMASLLGYMHAWTGRYLYAFPIEDSTDGSAITFSAATHRVYPTGMWYGHGFNMNVDTWMDMVAGDEAVYFFRSSDGGDTIVHEFRTQATQVGAGRPLWMPAEGFTGQRLVHHVGKLLIAGKFNGLCALYGLDTQTGVPFFAGYVGEGDAVTNIRAMSGSYGNEVLIVADNGTTSYVYVYDVARDALSTLDSWAISSLETGVAVTTTGARRLVANVDNSSTDFEVWSWNTDKATPAGAWTWEDTAWDFDTPYDGKTLLGFHVVQDPAISGTVTVSYLLDEDTGTGYTSAGATTGGSKHTYLDIASAVPATPVTKTFRTLRMKAVGASGARMLSITPRVYLNTYQEMWQLKVSTQTAVGGEVSRIADNFRTAAAIRSALLTLAASKTVVTFKDGRRFHPVKEDTADVGYSLHDVVVEDPVDRIDTRGEGYFQVTLRSVGV